MSNNHKMVSTILNYNEHLFFLTSAITGCISISIYASVFGSLLESTSSAIGLKVWAITEGIKRCKSIIKRKKIHGKIVLLGKI